MGEQEQQLARVPQVLVAAEAPEQACIRDRRRDRHKLSVSVSLLVLRGSLLLEQGRGMGRTWKRFIYIRLDFSAGGALDLSSHSHVSDS